MLPVTVTTTIGTSNIKSFTVVPSITSLSPNSGPVGASVTINGANFGFSGSVTFNGAKATTTGWGPYSIVATVPGDATTGNVVVTSKGVSSGGVSFVVVQGPAISSIAPSLGTRGILVTITGSRFGNSKGVVTLNGVNAVVISWSNTTITAEIPFDARLGVGSICVVAAGMKSNPITFTVILRKLKRRHPPRRHLLPY